jgi:hypothetical protein
MFVATGPKNHMTAVTAVTLRAVQATAPERRRAPAAAVTSRMPKAATARTNVLMPRIGGVE